MSCRKDIVSRDTGGLTKEIDKGIKKELKTPGCGIGLNQNLEDFFCQNSSET